MSVLYLITIILGVSFQNVVKKPFTQKTKGKGLFFFGLMVSFTAMLFFIVTAKGFEWNNKLIIYSICFAAAYTTSSVGTLYAVATGPLSLTSLIVSYSLILPTVYGLVFLNDPISLKLIIGIILLIISLFLINNKEKSEIIISFKWLIYVTLAFLGNGMASVFQKMQQAAFDGAYKNEFMIVSLGIVALFMGIFALKKERKEIKTYIKAGWHLAIACGIVNGITNLFVMILTNIMPVSIMFPMISAGGIIITYIVSRFFYKEKLSRLQFIGFVMGIASVIFLS